MVVKLQAKARRLKITAAVLLIIFILINVPGIYVGNIFYNQVLKMDVRKDSNTYEVFKSTFDYNRLNSLKMRDITIESRYGYELSGTYIKNPYATQNTVIIVHGITGSRWEAMKYSDIYLDLGFNVFLYDSRYHGQSGGPDISLGYFEKYDLDSCVQWVRKTNPEGLIGIHGESMGAATALLFSKMKDGKDDVSFYIVDSPYSDLTKLINDKAHDMLKVQNNFLRQAIILYSDIVVHYKANFSLYSVSPIKAIKDVETPIMFIHGKNDTFIPFTMTIDLYNEKKGAKALYIAPNAGHVESYMKNKAEYSIQVGNFLESIGIIDKKYPPENKGPARSI